MIDLVPIVLAVVVFILYCDLCFVYGDLSLIIVVMVWLFWMLCCGDCIWGLVVMVVI